MWRHIDDPSWIQYNLFRKNKLPGSKSRQSLYFFNLHATNRDIRNNIILSKMRPSLSQFCQFGTKESSFPSNTTRHWKLASYRTLFVFHIIVLFEVIAKSKIVPTRIGQHFKLATARSEFQCECKNPLTHTKKVSRKLCQSRDFWCSISWISDPARCDN